jgi:hypothetical protein
MWNLKKISGLPGRSHTLRNLIGGNLIGENLIGENHPSIRLGMVTILMVIIHAPEKAITRILRFHTLVPLHFGTVDHRHIDHHIMALRTMGHQKVLLANVLRHIMAPVNLQKVHQAVIP